MSGFRDQAFYNPLRDHGHWSPTSSTANFCEEDYNISFYVAEFISTLSNIAYVYYATCPPKLSVASRSHVADHRNGSSKIRRGSSSRKLVWDVHTWALISIGVTSSIFHATLQRFPQFLDESSMYFLAAGFTYDLLTTSYSTIAGKPAITHHYRAPAAAVILLIIVTTSTITLLTGDLLIHTFVFASMILTCGIKMSKLIRKHDKETKRKLYWHLFSADMALNLALALWIIDCSPSYCAQLRNFRIFLIDTLPAPLGLLLGFGTELHGWWHIFTARAAGEFVSLIRWLVHTAPDRTRDQAKITK